MLRLTITLGSPYKWHETLGITHTMFSIESHNIESRENYPSTTFNSFHGPTSHLFSEHPLYSHFSYYYNLGTRISNGKPMWLGVLSKNGYQTNTCLQDILLHAYNHSRLTILGSTINIKGWNSTCT